jgi:hypothetical protein
MSYLPVRDTFSDVSPKVVAALVGLSVAIDENSAREHCDDLFGNIDSKEAQTLIMNHEANSFETLLWLYKLGYLDNKALGC